MNVWLGPNGEVRRLVPVPRGADRVLRAVYVWCAMAAARHEALDDSRLRARLAKCREDLVFEAERAFRMHRIALDLAAEIHTERAARRKWELRLRARRTGQSPRRPWTTDRLFARYVFGVFAHDDRRLPIAGPRGVLP